MNTNTKKAIEIVGSVLAIVGGVRDLRKHRNGNRLELLRAALKTAVAILGIVIAVNAAGDIVDEAHK